MMQIVSLRALESLARERLDPTVYDFVAGGAEDEITLSANETAFGRIGLVPRVLAGKGNPDLSLTVLECRTAMPVLIAPTAFHRLVHDEGERATARAAAGAGVIMIASMAATMSIEEVAAAARSISVDDEPDLWFQLYIQPDLGFTEAIIRRAEAAGCKAIVVSVDSPAFGGRERDERNGFHDLPPGLQCENLRMPTAGCNGDRPRNIVFWPELSWRHVEWLRETTALKVVLKGIMHRTDAKIAAGIGVNAVLVSNHGGRQLDTVPPAIELLPPIADELGGRVPVLVDGGIRRGTDIVKAVALGAVAVAIGRPILWGLAVGGEAGVVQVLDRLRSELERALILCGCGSVADIGRDLVHLGRTEELCHRSLL